MTIQVGSAYGKIGLDATPFNAALGGANSSLRDFEAQVRQSTQAVGNDFTASLLAGGRALEELLERLGGANEGLGGTDEGAKRAGITVEDLTERLNLQVRQLSVLQAELSSTVSKYGEGTVQVERKQLALDKLTASIEQNKARLVEMGGSLDAVQTDVQELTIGVATGEEAMRSFHQSLLTTNTGLEAMEDKARRALEVVAEKAQQTETRIAALTQTINTQIRQLSIQQAELAATAEKYGEGTVQLERKRLAVESLSASIAQNTQRLVEMGGSLDGVQNDMQELTVGVATGEEAMEAFHQSLLTTNTGLEALEDKARRALEAVAEGAKRTESRIEGLTQQLNAQHRLLGVYQAELRATIAQYGEGTTQVERKRAAIESLSGSIAQNTRSLAALGGELSEVDNELREFTVGVNAADRASASFLQRMLAQAGGNLLSEGIQRLGETVVGLGRQMYDSNSAFEQYESQFTTLLGSVDAARERMTLLADFAKRTPFELPSVVEASRQLQVMTDGALATGEGLKLVGDTAAGTGRNFQEVAEWVGRAYNSIQAGRPFGEAAQELQRMGALSGDARTRMEELQKAGADNAEIWAILVGDLHRFTGQMDILSGDMVGLVSNARDAWDQLLRRAGDQGFKILEEALRGILENLDENADEINEFADELGGHLADIAEAALGVVEAVDWRGVAEGIITTAESAATLATAINTVAQAVEGVAGPLQKIKDFEEDELHLDFSTDGERINQYRGALEDLIPVIKEAFGDGTLNTFQFFGALSENIGFVEGAIRALLDVLRGMEVVVGDNLPPLERLIDKFIRFSENVLQADEAMRKAADDGFPKGQEATKRWGEEIEKADTLVEKLAERLGRIANLDIFESQIARVTEMADLTEDFADKSEDLGERLRRDNVAYGREVRGVLADLDKARDTYLESAEEKEAQTTARLGQLWRGYLDTLAGLGQQRREADAEERDATLAAEAQLKVALEELEADHNAELDNIQGERDEAEATRREGRLKAEETYQATRLEQERQHNEKAGDFALELSRKISDFLREQADQHKQHTDKLKALDADHAASRIKTLKAIEAADADLAKSELEIIRDRNRDLKELEAQRAADVKDAQRGIDDFLLDAVKTLTTRQQRLVEQGIDPTRFLSEEQRRDLERLQEEMGEVNAEYEREKADREMEAKLAEARVRERHDAAVQGLRDRLAAEDAEHQAAVEQEIARYANEQERRQFQFDRAVEDLNRKLEREDAAHDRAMAALELKRERDLAAIDRAYNEATAKLDARLATENASYAAQEEVLRAQNVQELADIQAKHDEAVAKLDARFVAERAKYVEQRDALIVAYNNELADLQASYQARVDAAGIKLGEIKDKHQESQEAIRGQLDETTRVYQRAMGEIALSTEPPRSALERLNEQLTLLDQATRRTYQVQVQVLGADALLPPPGPLPPTGPPPPPVMPSPLPFLTTPPVVGTGANLTVPTPLRSNSIPTSLRGGDGASLIGGGNGGMAPIVLQGPLVGSLTFGAGDVSEQVRKASEQFGKELYGAMMEAFNQSQSAQPSVGGFGGRVPS